MFNRQSLAFALAVVWVLFPSSSAAARDQDAPLIAPPTAAPPTLEAPADFTYQPEVSEAAGKSSWLHKYLEADAVRLPRYANSDNLSAFEPRSTPGDSVPQRMNPWQSSWNAAESFFNAFFGIKRPMVATASSRRNVGENGKPATVGMAMPGMLSGLKTPSTTLDGDAEEDIWQFPPGSVLNGQPYSPPLDGHFFRPQAAEPLSQVRPAQELGLQDGEAAAELLPILMRQRSALEGTVFNNPDFLPGVELAVDYDPHAAFVEQIRELEQKNVANANPGTDWNASMREPESNNFGQFQTPDQFVQRMLSQGQTVPQPSEFVRREYERPQALSPFGPSPTMQEPGVFVDREVQQSSFVPAPMLPGQLQTTPDESAIEILRSAAENMEQHANMLERQNLFDEADKLREMARELRRDARAQHRGEAIPAAPESSPYPAYATPSVPTYTQPVPDTSYHPVPDTPYLPSTAPIGPDSLYVPPTLAPPGIQQPIAPVVTPPAYVPGGAFTHGDVGIRLVDWDSGFAPNIDWGQGKFSMMLLDSQAPHREVPTRGTLEFVTHGLYPAYRPYPENFNK